ncbi:MAG: sugar phosphate nucleotidyltransferase, partial [Patescibacteria group bacterium]
MKCIILAAGEGKRLRPLTIDKPKPMVEVLGRPLLHHIIDSLPKEITELVLVVGYKAEAIQKYFGYKFEVLKVTYIRQNRPEGTAHALF